MCVRVLNFFFNNLLHFLTFFFLWVESEDKEEKKLLHFLIRRFFMNIIEQLKSQYIWFSSVINIITNLRILQEAEHNYDKRKV